MRSRISIKGCVHPSVGPSVTHELKPCKSDQNYYQYKQERILCRVSGLVLHVQRRVAWFAVVDNASSSVFRAILVKMNLNWIWIQKSINKDLLWPLIISNRRREHPETLFIQNTHVCTHARTLKHAWSYSRRERIHDDELYSNTNTQTHRHTHTHTN